MPSGPGVTSRRGWNDAGEWEKRAAADLVRCIKQITGGEPKLANTAETIAAALKAQTPVILVGQIALATEPALKQALAKVAKPNPHLRADAIVVKRAGNRVYLAGTNDDSHYYAASDLLQRWGCRWYLPTEFGKGIPQHTALKVGELDITVREITYDFVATRFLEPDQQGVVVVQPPVGVSSNQNRIAPGDLLVRVGDEPVADLAAFGAIIERARQRKPEEVVLFVERGRESFFFAVKPDWN